MKFKFVDDLENGMPGVVGLPIATTGQFNNEDKPIDGATLDRWSEQMNRDANTNGFLPVVKIGHGKMDGDGKPKKAIGFIKKVYREGEQLVADLVGNSKDFLQLLKGYPNRSIEYFNDARDGNGNRLDGITALAVMCNMPASKMISFRGAEPRVREVKNDLSLELNNFFTLMETKNREEVVEAEAQEVQAEGATSEATEPKTESAKVEEVETVEEVKEEVKTEPEAPKEEAREVAPKTRENELEAKLREAELELRSIKVNSRVEELIASASNDEGTVLPKFRESLVGLFSELDEAKADELESVLANAYKVKVRARGVSNPEAKTELSDEDQAKAISEKAKAIQKEKNISFGQALKIVS